MPDVKTELPRRLQKYFKNLTLTTNQKASGGGGSKHMEMSTKCTNNKILHIATYNTRSLPTDEILIEQEGELQHIKWEVVGLSEVRR